MPARQLGQAQSFHAWRQREASLAGDHHETVLGVEVDAGLVKASAEGRSEAALHLDGPALTTGVVDHQIHFGAAGAAIKERLAMLLCCQCWLEAAGYGQKRAPQPQPGLLPLKEQIRAELLQPLQRSRAVGRGLLAQELQGAEAIGVITAGQGDALDHQDVRCHGAPAKGG